MKRDLKDGLSDVSVFEKLTIILSLFVIISVLMLAFRDDVLNEDFVVAILCFGGIGIFFIPLSALKNLRSLKNELIIRSSFIGQKEVDERLTELAVNLRRGSKIASELQTEVSQTREPGLSLRERSESATASFKGYQGIFFELCKALEEAGYEVLKTTEGEYSMKLYWPKEEPKTKVLRGCGGRV